MLSVKQVLRFICSWPPYWAAGIRVSSLFERHDPHWRIDASEPSEHQYVGTHFGGNLYSM